jgi:hypothetical protein
MIVPGRQPVYHHQLVAAVVDDFDRHHRQAADNEDLAGARILAPFSLFVERSGGVACLTLWKGPSGETGVRTKKVSGTFF